MDSVLDRLPAGCPLRTKVSVPECRFAPRILGLLVSGGDLPVEGVGCPFADHCRLKKKGDADAPNPAK